MRMCKLYSTLLVTLHCALRRKDSHCAHWLAGSASAEKMGQGEVGWVAYRVTCIWWLLGLAVKAPYGLIFALVDWTGSENTTLILQGFISGREDSLDTERVYDNQKC